MMRYGIDLATLGEYADPRAAVQFAVAAEAAGWDAFFVWDHLAFAWGVPSGDPWVILAAAAQVTTRLSLGTAVTPLPRHRPPTLARTVASLDVLSQGRVIFGAGLGGVPQEFSAFGEDAGLRLRAAQLDEGLDVLAGLWSGAAFTYRGQHYAVEGVTLAPLPVQRPRVPIWIGGHARPALRRAARWDGWLEAADDEQSEMVARPEDVAANLAYIQQHRTAAAPFAVALTGVSPAGDSARVREYEAAGVNWWLESLHGLRGSRADLLARVMAGPPR
ncbi:MAG TPA: TIGR03619 family F420-dependent LLM class oxidoreductase [Longimicrobiales bacterium]